ncbi:MAG: alpha/beta hydrolase [Chloroflexota bacterium]
MTQHKTFRFTGLAGYNIFGQSWQPEGDPRAVLLIAHGLAEHSGRYAHLGQHLGGLGYSVYALDHRGHGQSDGVRADVVRFEDFLTDLHTFLGLVKEQQPGKKVFLIGHSMGGAIATLFAARHGAELSGLITSGAGVKVGGQVSPLLIGLSRLVAAVAPRLPVVVLEAEAVSRDPEVVARYRSDPLNYLGKVRARMGVQLLRGGELALQELPQIQLPALILHGTADRLADPEGSQAIYDGVRSADKTLKFYQGLYHEIFNEPEQQQVFADMAAWLEARLS